MGGGGGDKYKYKKLLQYNKYGTEVAIYHTFTCYVFIVFDLDEWCFF